MLICPLPSVTYLNQYPYLSEYRFSAGQLRPKILSFKDVQAGKPMWETSYHFLPEGHTSLQFYPYFLKSHFPLKQVSIPLGYPGAPVIKDL